MICVLSLTLKHAEKLHDREIRVGSVTDTEIRRSRNVQGHHQSASPDARSNGVRHGVHVAFGLMMPDNSTTNFAISSRHIIQMNKLARTNFLSCDLCAIDAFGNVNHHVRVSWCDMNAGEISQ